MPTRHAETDTVKTINSQCTSMGDFDKRGKRRASKMSSSHFCLVIIAVFALLFPMDSASDPRRQEMGGEPISGGVHERSIGENSAEIEELARFAVDEHNKKQNALLEFSRVLKAKAQVVAGTMHYLTVEAVEAGKKKIYEAKIWVKPWLNFKELQEFTHTGDSSATITPADLGAKRDGHERGWRTVPPHDPAVKDAANHAVKTIQQRSNSLAAYELLEILHSKAEVIEDLAKFDLLLKLRRGSKEEKYKVEVHKNLEGIFHLNQMQEEM